LEQCIGFLPILATIKTEF